MLVVKIIFVLIASGTVPFTKEDESNEEDQECTSIYGFGPTPAIRKIKVQVLYESLCVDSFMFLTDQLGPSYESLSDKIDITLVPFGIAFSIDNGTQFVCQHGSEECTLNRMHSCVMNQTSDQEKQVRFVVCQMNTRNMDDIRNCAQSVGLSEDINPCMSTQLGTILQLDAETITRKYRPQFIPAIIYNEKFDQELQSRSLSNFTGVVNSLVGELGSRC